MRNSAASDLGLRCLPYMGQHTATQINHDVTTK